MDKTNNIAGILFIFPAFRTSIIFRDFHGLRVQTSPKVGDERGMVRLCLYGDQFSATSFIVKVNVCPSGAS